MSGSCFVVHPPGELDVTYLDEDLRISRGDKVGGWEEAGAGKGWDGGRAPW
jgi:hypothetical protein